MRKCGSAADDAPRTFRVQQFLHSKLVLSSVKSQLQVLKWLGLVHLGGVVENVRSMAVEDGTECSAVTPTGGEVGHFNLITAVGEPIQTLVEAHMYSHMYVVASTMNNKETF